MISGQGFKLAPLYDVMCADAWEGIARNLAQKIAGKNRGGTSYALYSSLLQPSVRVGRSSSNARLYQQPIAGNRRPATCSQFTGIRAAASRRTERAPPLRKCGLGLSDGQNPKQNLPHKTNS
jgi:hypothetical protein